MKNFKVSGNQITFLNSRFYELNGTFVPSVTTILESYPKGPEFYAWLKKVGEDADEIRDAAGERGSTVHKLTEQYDEGLEVSLLNESGKLQYTLQEWSQFVRYTEFRAQVYPAMNIKQIEMQLIDTEMGCAGTLDRYVEIDGKHIILDIKTSNAVYPSYWLQVAVYRKMFERASGIKIDAVGILWLNAKTRGTQPKKIQGEGWQLLLKEDSTEDLELFDATHLLWKAQNKNLVPKQTSYQLSHQLINV